MIRKLLIFFCLALGLAACSIPDGTDPETEVARLLSDASRDVSSQHFDAAMEKALEALNLSGDHPLLKVQALSTIVGIDVMASRDADAWDKALEAESIARRFGFRKELAGILIAKAKLCSYAEISPETGRNDEGLSYATEALQLAELSEAWEEQCEACYVIGSLYINKNRWSNPIDPAIYRTAGEWLGRGEALADSCDIPRLRRNGILFRSRWFQQGGRNDEAIRYFEQVLGGLKETDYLTASALDDRLVRLYTRTGRYEDALDIHDDYVFRMQKYMQQKQDETLQEMQTRFEVQEKERALERHRYRITLLVLALLLCGAVIVLIVRRMQIIHKRNAELKRLSDSKEQIIALLSKDLKNPAGDMSKRIRQLSETAASLSADEIRDRCEDLTRSAEEMNADVARYVGDILIDRSKKMADIGLSAREVQIIRLSAEGLTAAEMAEKLFLSVHTVNTHRQRIYRKMDVSNVTDMIRRATELGIL